MVFTAGHDLRFETARLILRPFEDRDFDTALPFYRCPEFLRRMEGDPPDEVTREYLVEAANAMSREGFFFAIEEKSSERTIGEVCLQSMNLERGRVAGEKVMRMPIGIWDPTLWRRGYGKEVALRLAEHAFGVLEIDRLCAMDVDATNPHSRGLWESLGMNVARELDVGQFARSAAAANETVGRTLDYEISASTWCRLRGGEPNCGQR